MSRKTHHVVPNKERGGWDIKKGGSERASKHLDKKDQAVDQARIISKNQKSELIISGLNGRIQRSDSHGNDPCPPRDKK